MPTTTTRIGLKIPLGTENVTRENIDENWNIIEAVVAKQSDFAAHESDEVAHITLSERTTWCAKLSSATGCVLGADNQAVNKVKAVELKTDTRTTDFTRTGGKLTQAVEKDGATTVKTTTLNRDVYGVLQNAVEVAAGTTVTTTLNRTSGTLTSVTKVVT